VASTPLSGAYIEHLTGKSYALVFDKSQVSTWMYYPDKGPVVQSPASKTCLVSGANFSVAGDTLQISGGTPTSGGADATQSPLPIGGQATTMQILSHGFVLQLTTDGGKVVEFVKSV
jgi:hypothetical protein